MKKIIATLITLTALGCSYNKQVPSDNTEDSLLYQSDENHTVIYNVNTGKNEIMTIAPRIKDGDIKITDSGDTLYWLEGDTLGRGEYISKKKWQNYCKEIEELHKKYE